MEASEIMKRKVGLSGIENLGEKEEKIHNERRRTEGRKERVMR